MKFRKIFYWLLLVLVCFLIPQNQGFAQKWFGAATYQISFPTGDTKNFTDNTSFRGFGLDFRYTLNKSTTVGMTFGWNVFYERTNETFELGTENSGAITGTTGAFTAASSLTLGTASSTAGGIIMQNGTAKEDKNGEF